MDVMWIPVGLMPFLALLFWICYKLEIVTDDDLLALPLIGYAGSMAYMAIIFCLIGTGVIHH